MEGGRGTRRGLAWQLRESRSAIFHHPSDEAGDVFLGHSCIPSEAIMYIIIWRFSVAAHRRGVLGAWQTLEGIVKGREAIDGDLSV